MKKAQHRSRSAASRRAGYDRPLEFERGWNELEARHDQIKMDWSSLAAQLGITADGQ